MIRKKVGNVFSREVRKYIYGIGIAFVPVAVYFGWIDLEASVLILPLLLAILNLNPKPGDWVEDSSGVHSDGM